MLHTLYQRNVRARTQFFVKWMALDLVRDASAPVLGVTALEMETGEVMVLTRARRFSRPAGRADLLLHDKAFICTGDGLGMAARAGFLSKTWSSGVSPDGRRGAGVLITEGVLGEVATSQQGGASASWSATPEPEDLHRATCRFARHGDRDQEGRGAGRRRLPAAATRPSRPGGIEKRLPGIGENARRNSPTSTR